MNGEVPARVQRADDRCTHVLRRARDWLAEHGRTQNRCADHYQQDKSPSLHRNPPYTLLLGRIEGRPLLRLCNRGSTLRLIEPRKWEAAASREARRRALLRYALG